MSVPRRTRVSVHFYSAHLHRDHAKHKIALTNGLLAFVAFATSLLGGFLAVLFTVFMALYLTIDAPRMRDYLVVFWPPDRQQRASRMSVEMGARLGKWAIGQSRRCVRSSAVARGSRCN